MTNAKTSQTEVCRARLNNDLLNPDLGSEIRGRIREEHVVDNSLRNHKSACPHSVDAPSEIRMLSMLYPPFNSSLMVEHGSKNKKATPYLTVQNAAKVLVRGVSLLPYD